MQRSVFAFAAIASTLGALALAGCSAGYVAPSADSSRISVVAATNAWGDVAKQIGGGDVSVTSIIDDPDKDPHEYQASGQDQLKLSKAQVVIVNGAGYDDFVGDMLAALHTRPIVVNVADVSGYDQHAAGFNEHLWYDFGTVQKVAQRLEAAYEKTRPSATAAFQANTKAFAASLGRLSQREAHLKAQYAGEGVAITEPVPLYMLEAIGLVDKTPDKFSEAVENDTDVAPAVLHETLDLFSTHSVALLAYNEQTTGVQTRKVLEAARANDVPVVAVAETMPKGATYLTWMRANLDAIAAALGKVAS